MYSTPDLSILGIQDVEVKSLECLEFHIVFGFLACTQGYDAVKLTRIRECLHTAAIYVSEQAEHDFVVDKGDVL